MTKINQIYRCSLCGNITEVLHIGEGELVCCGKPMELQKEKEEEVGKEKHLPVIKQEIDGQIIIEIGEVGHPMEREHFIEWIEVVSERKIFRKFLKPEESPRASFKIKDKVISVRAYCNIHGLWVKNL